MKNFSLQKNNVILYFDKDYDERLKSHIDPSKTAVLENPERSILVNPYLYNASSFSKDEKMRTQPSIQHARELLEGQVQSVAQGLSLIRESFDRRDEKGWGSSNNTCSIPVSHEEKKTIPQLFIMTQSGELQPTNYFWQLLDRINECNVIEKQAARELGHLEGYDALSKIESRANKGLCNIAVESEKLLKEHSFPDLSQQLQQVYCAEACDTLTNHLQKAWEIQQENNLDPDKPLYFG